MITRREMLALLACSADAAFAQGVASRGVRPPPRGKQSGLPFHLVSPMSPQPPVSGSRSSTVVEKDYVLEAVGCGAAFFDYDNDGWLDIFF